MYALVLLRINQLTKFETPSFSIQRNGWGKIKRNGSRDPDHAH